MASFQSTRRGFLGTAALGGAGLLMSGRSWGSSANEKLNLAIIGAGGRGSANISEVAGENIVALCDVDERRAADSSGRYPLAKKYHDFRRLLDEMDQQIDAVVISAPNHIHAPASVMAMRMGKHVYCEKPGAHSVSEARTAAQVADQQKVATQLGTQIHASENYRRVVELIRGGTIGEVRECHIWLRSTRGDAGDRPAEMPPVPPELQWDLFLGPAPERPYHPMYVPHGWHWWWDFGGGEIGNMGCHYLDLPFWALELDHPLTVEAEGSSLHLESAPSRQYVRFEFASRGDLPPVTLTWTHGPESPRIFADSKLPDWAWGVFIGSEGMLLVSYDQRMLWPEEKFADYVPPEPTIPPSVGHHQEWIDACKTGSETSCHFGYSSRITEAVLLGNVAYRCGTKIEWDAAGLSVPNVLQADELLRRDYRPGWVL